VKRPVTKENNNWRVADFGELSDRAVLKTTARILKKKNEFEALHCVQRYCSLCCCCFKIKQTLKKLFKIKIKV